MMLYHKHFNHNSKKDYIQNYMLSLTKPVFRLLSTRTALTRYTVQTWEKHWSTPGDVWVLTKGYGALGNEAFCEYALTHVAW